MAPVRVHPPPGRGGSRQSEGQCRWVSHKQGRGWNGPGRWGWDSRSPAAALWSDSASKRARSQRCADSKAPCGLAAAHGVRMLAAAVWGGLGWKPAFSWDAITTGGSKGARARAAGGPLLAGKRWPSSGSICGSISGGGTIAVRNGGRKGWALGRWRRAAGRIGVRSSGPAGFGLRPGRNSVGLGELLAHRAPAAAVPAQTLRQAVRNENAPCAAFAAGRVLGWEPVPAARTRLRACELAPGAAFAFRPGPADSTLPGRAGDICATH